MGVDARQIPDAREIPDSIQWHEGLLLTPQHFQQLALRQESLLQYNAAMVAPFYWGIRYLQIEETKLFGGEVQIKQVEAVMPDGLVVSHLEGTDLRVDLKTVQEIKHKPVKIHLAVAARKSDYASKGNHARYNSYEGEPVVDVTTGEGKVRIPRLVPRLELIAGETPPAKYTSFPLMEVEYKNDGFKQTDFIPPLLIVTSKQQAGAQPQLGSWCWTIARMVRGKAQELAGQAESQSQGTMTRLDLETKSWIRSLAASLPHLEAILDTEVSHPYPIFLALCSMAGHLAAMGPKLVPDAPFYNHNDLRSSFEPVIRYIEQAIREGLTSSYQSYPFTYQEREGVYERNFEADWRNRRLIIALRAQAGVSVTDMIKWGEDCLIGSKRHLQSMRENRILGARRKYIEGDEELVPSRGVVLFAVKPDPEFIEPDEPLQIFNRGERAHAHRPVEIVLHVKKPA
jgi:type VI secretion system protein ImpJ